MKKLSFLVKLYKKGVIKVVAPSDEIRDSYFSKSESYLDSAKILIKENKLEETVSLLYYSMYYSLLGLLFEIGIKSENHIASIELLSSVFGIDPKEIVFARRERINKQYYVDFKISKDDVDKLVKIAEDFSSKIQDYSSKLTSSKIGELRKTFTKWLNSVQL
jgi:uncharacterized protein (UPF0332 family)